MSRVKIAVLMAPNICDVGVVVKRQVNAQVHFISYVASLYSRSPSTIWVSSDSIYALSSSTFGGSLCVRCLFESRSQTRSLSVIGSLVGLNSCSMTPLCSSCGENGQMCSFCTPVNTAKARWFAEIRLHHCMLLT